MCMIIAAYHIPLAAHCVMQSRKCRLRLIVDKLWFAHQGFLEIVCSLWSLSQKGFFARFANVKENFYCIFSFD